MRESWVPFKKKHIDYKSLRRCDLVQHTDSDSDSLETCVSATVLLFVTTRYRVFRHAFRHALRHVPVHVFRHGGLGMVV